MLMHEALPADTSAPAPMPVAVRDCLAAVRAASVARSAPATWLAMDVEVRTILVMLTGDDADGDPARFAAKAWGQFTLERRSQIAHLGRRMFKNLATAMYL